MRNVTMSVSNPYLHATCGSFVQDTNNREPCIDELEIYAVAADGKPARNVALASAGAKASSSGKLR